METKKKDQEIMVYYTPLPYPIFYRWGKCYTISWNENYTISRKVIKIPSKIIGCDLIEYSVRSVISSKLRLPSSRFSITQYVLCSYCQVVTVSNSYYITGDYA